MSMKRTVSVLLNNILIPDPYLNDSRFTKIKSAKDQMSIAYVDEPLQTEGVPVFTDMIKIFPIQSPAEITVPQRFTFAFDIGMMSQVSPDTVLDLWENADPAVITAYGSVQGIKPLLHGRRYSFGDFTFELIWHTRGPRLMKDQETNTFVLTAHFEASCRLNEVFKYA